MSESVELIREQGKRGTSCLTPFADANNHQTLRVFLLTTFGWFAAYFPVYASVNRAMSSP